MKDLIFNEFNYLWTLTNMQKCDMWKPGTNNHTLPAGVTPVEGHQEKYNMQKDCELENKLRLHKKIEMFEEI